MTNVGTEFQLRPVNYFDQLASLDVDENNAFGCVHASARQLL